jgi:hypothetical protein
VNGLAAELEAVRQAIAGNSPYLTLLMDMQEEAFARLSHVENAIAHNSPPMPSESSPPVTGPANSGEWITHAELAAQLGLSPEGLRKRRVKNALSYEWKQSGKTYLYRPL